MAAATAATPEGTETPPMLAESVPFQPSPQTEFDPSFLTSPLSSSAHSLSSVSGAIGCAIATVEELLEAIDAHRTAFIAHTLPNDPAPGMDLPSAPANGPAGTPAASDVPAPKKSFAAALAADLVDYVKCVLQPLSIRVVAEPVETLADPSAMRLLLSTSREASAFNIPLVRRANGLVLRVPLTKQSEPATLLVQPPSTFVTRHDKHALETLLELDLYKVYAMREGTTLTLYHYNGRWVISSRRSYEADDLVWRGFRFRRVLEHTLRVACPRFNWATLKPGHTYTIGYHHPAHHPFGQNGMWAPDLFEKVSSKDSSRRGWLIEAWFIRSSEPASVEDVAACVGIPLQAELSTPPSLNAMSNHNKAALEEHRAQLRTKSPRVQPRPHMGYILRSRNEERTGALSDVLLTSRLYEAIRDLFYESSYRRQDVVLAINYRHLSFVLLGNYINQHKNAIMQELFPQFKTYYDYYKFVFNKAVEFIALMAGGTPLAEPALDVSPPWFTAYLLALRLGHRILAAYTPGLVHIEGAPTKPHGGRHGRHRPRAWQDSTSANVLMQLLCDYQHVQPIYDVVHVEGPRLLREREERAARLSAGPRLSPAQVRSPGPTSSPIDSISEPVV